MYSAPLRSLTNSRDVPGSGRITLTRASDPSLPAPVGDPVTGIVAKSVRVRVSGVCAGRTARTRKSVAVRGFMGSSLAYRRTAYHENLSSNPHLGNAGSGFWLLASGFWL